MDNAYTPRESGPSLHDHQHLDAGQLDRLDWFIYQLKQQGIYVNLNLHVSRMLDDSDGFPNSKLLPHYNKGRRQLRCGHDRDAEELRPRPAHPYQSLHQELQYVNEPCVALVEMNNENSLLGFASTAHCMTCPSHISANCVAIGLIT